MSTGSRRAGRDVVLVGYVAIAVSLGRAGADLFSSYQGSLLAPAAEVKQINFGYELLYILFLLGMIIAAWFVVSIARIEGEATQQMKTVKVATLVFAGQSFLFATGLLVFVVNELTLHYPHLVHTGPGGFAWVYPAIGGLYFAAVGYLLMLTSWNSSSARSTEELPAPSNTNMSSST